MAIDSEASSDIIATRTSAVDQKTKAQSPQKNFLIASPQLAVGNATMRPTISIFLKRFLS